MFFYHILSVGTNFVYKPQLLPALKNAGDRLELSKSVVWSDLVCNKIKFQRASQANKFSVKLWLFSYLSVKTWTVSQRRFFWVLTTYVFFFFLLVWFDSLRPINNLSVIKGRVFLGWTSTRLGLMFLLKDTRQWRRWGSNQHMFWLRNWKIIFCYGAWILAINAFVWKESWNHDFSIIVEVKFCTLSMQAWYSKDRPVCYGTSQLKTLVCVNTRYALLKTPTLKSNMRWMPINNPSVETSDKL